MINPPDDVPSNVTSQRTVRRREERHTRRDVGVEAERLESVLVVFGARHESDQLFTGPRLSPGTRIRNIQRGEYGPHGDRLDEEGQTQFREVLYHTINAVLERELARARML